MLTLPLLGADIGVLVLGVMPINLEGASRIERKLPNLVTLKMVVVSGEDLPPLDIYCEIHASTKIQKTSVRSDSSRPEWNEEFIVEFVDKFDIKVCDANILVDEFLGEVTIEAKQLQDVFTKKEETYKCYGLTNAKRGRLHLAFTPVEEPTLPPFSEEMRKVSGYRPSLMHSQTPEMVILAVVVSFLFGLLEFTPLFVFALIFFGAWHYIIRRKKFAALIATESALRRQYSQMYPSFETGEWLNKTLRHALLRHRLGLQEFLKDTINREITNNCPSFLACQIANLELNTVAPVIECLSANTKSSNLLELDTYVQYMGDMKILAEIGVKFIPFRLKVEIEKIVLSAKVRVEAQHSDSFPFIEAVAFEFMQPPMIDFQVRIHKSFVDINSIPGIVPLLDDILRFLILDNLFLYPNQFVYDLSYLAQTMGEGTGGEAPAATAAAAPTTLPRTQSSTPSTPLPNNRPAPMPKEDSFSLLPPMCATGEAVSSIADLDLTKF
eukprot:TRINITY_DN2506_c0_g1_i1.p1 TRINITY_DN2506_c0_g1~~TRINITY_DN2506_c0_g1_i1.p1  ORF type:complete len:496 (-),score=104.74 TRINITY_DN2506_c0_g1_i1:52-1539(-)